MASVAVVILNWNGRVFLEKFLQSLTEHTLRPAVSLVVIDNGSIDDSCAFVQAHHPEVQLVVLDKNYGYTGGYNIGLQGITADYYVLLNSDVEVSAHWLEPLLDLMEKTTGGGCMYAEN